MLYQLKRETIHQFTYTLELIYLNFRIETIQLFQHMLIAHVSINAWIGFTQFMGFTKHHVFDHVDIRFYIHLNGLYNGMTVNRNYLVNLHFLRLNECNYFLFIL